MKKMTYTVNLSDQTGVTDDYISAYTVKLSDMTGVADDYIRGDSLEDLAQELVSREWRAGHVRVSNEQGFVVGWIGVDAGKPYWRYA
jgi:hypothetical protein